MSQLPLNFRKKLRYDPQKFLWHQGITTIHSFFKTFLSGMSFIYAEPRSGKTHLAVSVAELLLGRGFYPQLISDLSHDVGEKDILILDNAEQYFSTLSDSGVFINAFENIKKNNASLILLSQKKADDLPADEHILSRINSMSIFQVLDPAPEDLFQLIYLMCRQHSIALSDAHCKYLSARLPRKISQIEEYIERLHYFILNSSEPVTRSVLRRVL